MALSTEEQTRLAQPLPEYFAKTYGVLCWVLGYESYREGRRAYTMDFSSMDYAPGWAQKLPEHERRWFSAAAMRDYWASYATNRGTVWAWFIDTEPVPLTDEHPHIIL